MKLLIIDTSPIVGGAETYLLELSKFLEKRYKLFFILSAKNPLSNEFKKLGQVSFSETGDSLEKWRGLNVFSPTNLFYQNKLKQCITEFSTHFDFIFLAGYLKDLFLFHNILDKPQFFIFHTPPPNWLARQPFKNVFIKAANNIKKIIAVSDFNARWLSQMIPREKIITIKNGVDIKKFSPPKESEKEKIKAQIPLPLDNIIIGNTSRIHKAKGQIKLLKIFKNLKAKYPNLSLLLVNGGSRKAEKQLKKEIIKLDLKQHVFWFGFQKDMAEFYQAMDILAMPSLSESFGLCALEAMSCGIPVVAFNIGGVPEVVSNNKTGFLVSPDDLLDFQKKLEILIRKSDLRKKFGVIGRQKAERNFNQKLTFAKFEKLIRSKN